MGFGGLASVTAVSRVHMSHNMTSGVVMRIHLLLTITTHDDA